MQLVSCCIDRNECSPVVPTVETWKVRATKVCQLSAFRPAEGSVSQGKPIFTAPMARCTIFLETRAVAQHLEVLCILRHTLVPRSCAEEYALGPILSQRIQTVSHILFVGECNESAPYLEANSTEMLMKMSTVYGTRTFINVFTVTLYFCLASNILSPSRKLVKNTFPK